MVVFPVLNYHLRTSASYTSWHMNIVNVTVCPYGVPQYQHPVFYGVRVPLTFVTVKCYMGRLFIFFLLTIVLPVLQFTDSDYTFDSFIFFYIQNGKLVILVIIISIFLIGRDVDVGTTRMWTQQQYNYKGKTTNISKQNNYRERKHVLSKSQFIYLSMRLRICTWFVFST